MKSWVLAAAMLVLVVPEAGMSATYYIDFASGSDANVATSKSSPWKYAPGMTGYTNTGYVHSAGDQFIFKGGVTWDSTIFNWKISNSGSSGNADYYGVDQTWFSGASWTQPIFDGGGTVAQANTAAILVTGSYVTLDNIKIQNLGQAYTYNGGYVVEFLNDHDITIENCTLAPQSRIGVLINDSVGSTTLSNFTVQKNDISDVSWGVAAAPSANGAIMSNLVIARNKIHDFTTQMCGGVHGDGIITYRGNTSNTSGNYISTAYIYDNQWYGDFHVDSTKDSCINNCSSSNPCGMNAFVFVQNAENTTTYLYNNSATYTNVSGYNGSVTDMNALFNLGGDASFSNTFYIYNNSFQADSSVGHGFALAKATSTVFENNIMVGTQFPLVPIDTTSCSGFSADYNDYYNFTSGTVAAFPSACGGFQSWTQYHSTNSKESHSLNVSPLFVSRTNLQLSECSGVIRKGTNLSAIFTVDANATPRPASGAWDMGAFVHGSTPCPPASAQAVAH